MAVFFEDRGFNPQWLTL